MHSENANQAIPPFNILTIKPKIMKKLNLILYSIFFAALIINPGCKPEKFSPGHIRVPNPPPPPPPPTQQPFGMNTGVDVTIETPINFAILHGYAYYNTGGLKFRWEKITGPSSYSLQDPDSLITKVSNLVLGVYQFELKATDTAGNSIRDTMTVNVEPATSPGNQVYFWDLTWICPVGGCGIMLDDVYSYVPANTPFNLYIMRDNSSGWELIVPYSPGTTSTYLYSVWNTSIEVWEEPIITVNDTPAIKVVF